MRIVFIRNVLKGKAGLFDDDVARFIRTEHVLNGCTIHLVVVVLVVMAMIVVIVIVIVLAV